jgi:ADP-ribose pyrophosphatase YjhB (NUDIX family)
MPNPLPEGSLIASGPVIIEDGKVLLNREYKPDGISEWFFPGGQVEQFDISLEKVCIRETKEEMGIDIEIIQPLWPMMITHKGRVVILIHYLAKRSGEVTPGKEVAEWAWHDIHNLPENCGPNVKEIMKRYNEETTMM